MHSIYIVILTMVCGFVVCAENAGPSAALAENGTELLKDPGWEARSVSEALPQENPWSTSWMGWGLPAQMVITGNPDQVHSGKRALMVRPTGNLFSGFSGFRTAFKIQARPGTCYDFSAWVKGEGWVQPHFVGDFSSPHIMLSPTEWRQIHLVYCADNPAKKSFSTGFLVNGRLFIDDLSVRQISAKAAAVLRETNDELVAPDKVEQTIPAGEKRSSRKVELENAHLKVELSPQGGGRVVRFVDKDRKVEWNNQALLKIDFPGQPVNVVCDIPYQTKVAKNGVEVVFSHQYTGGDAAPFLDGVLVEQIFQLEPEARSLRVTYRLTNKSKTVRLPNPSVVSSISGDAGRCLQAEGDQGAVFAEGKAITVRNLVSGWMAGSTAKGSLVFGFDVRAVQEGVLDAEHRTATWSYLRVMLPPGKSWETCAWMTAVPLPEISYADANVAVLTSVKKIGKDCEFSLETVPLTSSVLNVSARIIDYGGAPIAKAETGRTKVRFPSPSGRFITALDIADGERTHTVELFNDPRVREQKDAGIQGAGKVQYCPTVPARVLRLPEVGDLRAEIAKSRAVLWGKGLFYQYLPLEPALGKLNFTVKSVEYQGALPEELAEYLPFRLVILSNMGAAHLSPMARAALSQYVRAGGNLLVTGGSMSLGNALSTGTDLEDLLPVTLDGAFDVRPCYESQKLLAPANGSFVESLPWQDGPRIYWRHNIKAKPGAVIHATAGSEPVLLEWACGYGKVMLFAGTVEGDPLAGEVAVWNWKGWTDLWNLVLQRLLP